MTFLSPGGVASRIVGLDVEMNPARVLHRLDKNLHLVRRTFERRRAPEPRSVGSRKASVLTDMLNLMFAQRNTAPVTRQREAPGQ